jgi:hypothetical protein
MKEPPIVGEDFAVREAVGFRIRIIGSIDSERGVGETYAITCTRGDHYLIGPADVIGQDAPRWSARSTL